MKSLVLLSCAFMFVNGLDKALIEEIAAKVQEFGIECVEQEKPPPSDIEAFMNKQLPSSHEGKCTMFCTMKKFNILTDATSAGPGYTEWLEKAQADDPEFYANLVKLYKICAPTVKGNGDDGCENAFVFAQCCVEEGKKLGLNEIADLF